MNNADNRLSLRAAMERIVEYADGGVATERPLVVRTDSIVTSDILRYAAVRLIQNAKKVTIGADAIIDDGLDV